MKSTDVRPGMAIRFDGKLFLITRTEHRTPGNLRAFMQIKMKDIKSGVIIERRFASSEEVEEAMLDRREIEYIYSDNTGHVFMDTETYDQITLDAAAVGEAMQYLKPNTKVIGLFNESKLLSLELPNVVDLKVVDTPPGIKGATATNQLKEATMETGLKTKVPPFINIGEMLRISTETGQYLSRVT